MHRQARSFVRNVVQDYHLNTPATTVLEIGSRDVNGSVRDLLSQVARYVGVDLLSGQGVDVVANALALPFRMPFDVVLCLEVLEHSPAAPAILAAAHSHLRPGGLLVLTCATTGRPPHSGGGGPLQPGMFYHNVTLAELTNYLQPFEVLELRVERAHHDLHALARRRLV